jgi:arginase family enzyme
MTANPYVERIQHADSRDHEADPLPGWAGVATLFGSKPVERVPESGAGSWVTTGVPFDATSSSRPGSAEGPRAIRSSSLVYANSLKSLGETEMTDMRTGERFAYRTPALSDLSDCRVYPTDILRTFDSVVGTTYEVARSGASLLLLGGDHSVTFPSFAGVWRAAHERSESTRIGFVNVDHHFDFGGHSTIHGPLYHGSNSRRVSELPGMRPEDMAFVGVGDVTRTAQLEGLRADGYTICGVRDLRHQVGIALRPVVERLGETCDTVYVSMDIDVADASVAPGTGNVTAGGLGAGDVIDIVIELSALPLCGFDITEVSPRYDPTGRTAQFAARVLYELLFRTPSAALADDVS